MKDKINGRTPEEIKKGLECCINWETGCIECPYNNLPHDECVVAMKSDNIAYIQQLERERDAAVEELKIYKFCTACIHDNENVDVYENSPCFGCSSKSNWQWRGVEGVQK